MDGFLCIDKPLHLTSHDVVARVRRAAGMKRVGHAGTLDPLATGVLVIGLGKATRLLEYAMSQEKVYKAEVTLGSTSATDDAEGPLEPVWTGTEWPSLPQVEAVLQQFIGEISQIPPQFSAIKQQGVAAFDQARQGKHVDIPARTVTVFAIKVLEYSAPILRLEIRCSKGTYIRSLARDMGQKLQTGAYLSALQRTHSGSFSLDQALPLTTIEEHLTNNRLECLLPLDVAIQDLPRITVIDEQKDQIVWGQLLTLADLTAKSPVAAYFEEQLLAILVSTPEGLWQPHKVFLPSPVVTERATA